MSYSLNLSTYLTATLALTAMNYLLYALLIISLFMLSVLGGKTHKDDLYIVPLVVCCCENGLTFSNNFMMGPLVCSYGQRSLEVKL